MHRVVSVTCLAVVVTLASRSVEASTYFPNRSTDIYVYRSLRTGAETTARVDAMSRTWAHWTEFGGLGPMWVAAPAGSEQVWVNANGNTQLFADFNARLGTAWRIFVLPHHNPGTVTLTARGLTVATPGGTFRNCAELTLRPSSSDAGVVSIVFAPGFGVVRWDSQSIAGPVRSVFVRGVVNGVRYPRLVAAGIVVSAWVDAYVYFTDPLWGRSNPTVATASIEVRNRTAGPIGFSFASGQSFDIEVIDANGRVVSRWSRGRVFTGTARQLLLAAGASWRFTGEVDLNDDTGRPLPSGSYTVRAFLTSDPSYAAAFDVRLVPAQ